MTVWVEIDLCDGCRRCIKACPYDAVELKDGKAFIGERCTSCGACMQACKNSAIVSDIEEKKIPDFSDWQGVWVFAEQREGALNPVCFELLGAARQLAEALDQQVGAVLPGSGVARLADDLIRFGADKVFLAEHDALKDYRTIPYTDVISGMIEAHRPNVFLLGASHIGRDLAPRISRRVGAGLTADCTDLSIDPEEKILLQTRPAFGGNIMATIANRYSRPQMATVRPGVMSASEKPGHKGQIIEVPVQLDTAGIRTRVIEKKKETKKQIDLSKAKVIIAGGRGVGDEAGFNLLKELADIMGGEVAGTRVTVEEGWIPPERQVGQTGRTVRPEIYIACGISGAVQHRAGMTESRYIIAINKDPRAPIFSVADWGIVGDLHEVVPEMIRQLRRSQE